MDVPNAELQAIDLQALVIDDSNTAHTASEWRQILDTHIAQLTTAEKAGLAKRIFLGGWVSSYTSDDWKISETKNLSAIGLNFVRAPDSNVPKVENLTAFRLCKAYAFPCMMFMKKYYDVKTFSDPPSASLDKPSRMPTLSAFCDAPVEILMWGFPGAEAILYEDIKPAKFHPQWRANLEAGVYLLLYSATVRATGNQAVDTMIRAIGRDKLLRLVKAGKINPQRIKETLKGKGVVVSTSKNGSFSGDSAEILSRLF